MFARPCKRGITFTYSVWWFVSDIRRRVVGLFAREMWQWRPWHSNSLLRERHWQRTGSQWQVLWRQ